MARTLSMNSGSGDSLKLSTRCGLSPKARQIREIADWDIPVARAIERVDHCVASSGVSSNVLTITRSTSSSLDRPWCTRPGLIVQPVQTSMEEPAPPLGDRPPPHTQPNCDRRVGLALSASQHDTTTQRQRLSTLRSPHPTLQSRALLLAQHQRRKMRIRHDRLPSWSDTTTERDHTLKTPKLRKFSDSGH